MADQDLGWTDARVELLKKFYSEGELSASQMAVELGGGLSRNAVIGKIHRLGIRKEPTVKRTRRPSTVSPAALATKVLRGVAGEKRRQQRTEAALEFDAAEIPAEDARIPETQRVTLLDLTDAKCHWPIGDPLKPDFSFCGSRSVSGQPYCAQHCRIAFTPNAIRRRSA